MSLWAHKPHTSRWLTLLCAGARSSSSSWWFGMMRNVSVPVRPAIKAHTSSTLRPRISVPLISRISSPSCSSPLASAAPPRTIRPITTLPSPSLRTVAPWERAKVYRITVLFRSVSSERWALLCCITTCMLLSHCCFTHKNVLLGSCYCLTLLQKNSNAVWTFSELKWKIYLQPLKICTNGSAVLVISDNSPFHIVHKYSHSQHHILTSGSAVLVIWTILMLSSPYCDARSYRYSLSASSSGVVVAGWWAFSWAVATLSWL